MTAIEEMSCVNGVVTLDVTDIYEILNLLESDPKYKTYAQLKARNILKIYEFQQK